MEVDEVSQLSVIVYLASSVKTFSIFKVNCAIYYSVRSRNSVFGDGGGLGGGGVINS